MVYREKYMCRGRAAERKKQISIKAEREADKAR